MVESRRTLIWNWHLDAICDHLEAVTNTYIIKSGLVDTGKDGFVFEADYNIPSVSYLWINIPPRHTKLIADSQTIFTPDGWRKHGDLRIGDCVFGSDGNPAKIIGTTPKDIADIDITFSNGETIKCNQDHLWTVYDRSSKKWATRTTKSMMNVKYLSISDDKKRARFQLPLSPLCNFKEKELPIDPYFLGLWLRDGTSNKPAISHDKYKIKPILKKLEQRDIIETKRYNNAVGFGSNGNSIRVEFRRQNILGAMRKLNIYNNKHIPNIYKQSSKKQRLELIAGYIDTDGSCDKNGRIRIGTTSNRLCNDIYDVALSLGWSPYITEREDAKCKNGKYYTVGFNPLDDIPNVNLNKKSKRKPLRRRIGIIGIKKSDNPESGNCISVENKDGLYLVGKKNILTHNSLIVGVFWPTWEWGARNLSEMQYLFTSYAQGLSTRDSIKRRKIIESKWYQSNWGNRFQLMADNNQKMRYGNDNNGHMISTSIRGMATGEGGDRIICLPYDEVVMTDQGNIKIGKIVEQKLDVKIISMNAHDPYGTNADDIPLFGVITDDIEEYQINPGADIYEMELIDRTKMQCTLNHEIYESNFQCYMPLSKWMDYGKNENFKSNLRPLKIPYKNLQDYKTCHSDYFNHEHEIKSIRKVGYADKTYNLKIAKNHNYFANGILVHNCDDAHNVNEVESDLKRQEVLNTWDDSMSSRINDEDTGAYIGIMQRTAHNDLTGHILNKTKTDPFKDFAYLCLPARYEKVHPNPSNTPLNFKDPRKKEGELIDKQRWGNGKLDNREKRMTQWAISGQNQQRPTPKGGTIVKVGKMQIIDDYNDRYIEKTCRYWDKAVTIDKSASKTASILMAFMKPEFTQYGVLILDCVTGQWGTGDRENKIRQTAILDGIETEVGVEQEPGSGGKESAINTTTKTLLGFKSFADRPSGAKEVRLEPFAAQVEHSNVAILNREWTKEYLGSLEICKVGNVTDEADATSGAFNRLAGLTEKKKAKVRVGVG